MTVVEGLDAYLWNENIQCYKKKSLVALKNENKKKKKGTERTYVGAAQRSRLPTTPDNVQVH